MLDDSLTPQQIATAVGFFAGGIVLGFVFYYLILGRLKRRVTITSWGGDDIVVGAVHDLVLVLFTVAGAYGATVTLPLRADVADIISEVLLAIALLWLTVVASRATRDAVRLWALRTRGVIPGGSILVNIARLTVFLVGALILLQTLGISIAPILTALGVGGLAVALALQNTLSNLFAGLHIIASRQVRLGDYIKLDTGQEGYVTDINWRTTAIRQLPNNMVLVPNARLAEAIVINYYQPQQEMAVLLDVGVAYDSDLAKVERVTIEVAQEVMKEVAGGVPEFEPFIRYHTFDDSSINFTVILRAKEFTDQFLVKHEFVKRLQRRFDKDKITIPFPIRTVVFPDGPPPARQPAPRAGR